MTNAAAQPHILQQFNRCAIAHRFTGVQTQLWQCLYWLTYTYGQGVCIPTYHLLETMGISRSQLLRARKALEDAGCLRTHKTGAQRTHYTVLIDGEIVVGEGSALPQNRTNALPQNRTNALPQNHHGTGSAPKCASPSPTTRKPTGAKQSGKSIPTGVAPQPDIVMNGRMEQEIAAFTTQHSYSALAQRRLLAWCRMRKSNGWTMTASGFANTMAELQTLCGGDETMLIKIVDRTLQHRWKGFHPYKIDTSPVGDGSSVPKKYQKQSSQLPRYETKMEDLDYLEW